MLKSRRLIGALAALLVAVLVPVGLSARNRKGDKFLKEGRAAEAREQWDAALEAYEEAVNEDPTDTGYLIAMRKARFEAGQKHVNAAEKLRTEGKLSEAMQEFQKALIADPASAMAIQGIRRVQDMLNTPQSSVKPEERNLTPAERQRRDSQDRVDSMLEPPTLKPMALMIPTLKMNNQPPRILYETVAKLAGVNVVFDSQYNPPGRNFNVDLSNVTAEQAFDYLGLLTHTFWKPITGNTIFVAEDNVTKRRDYEDDVVKVFYVTNATSVQEFQEIATAIRTVAEIRRVFTYNAQRAMIVRDTVDKVALAEKLVHDLDKPKSEVLVDVMVLEANSERTRDLAATIASAGTAGINVPINFAPPTAAATAAGGAAAAATIPLSGLRSLSTNQFSTTLPGGLLTALLSDTRTKVMNNPQVRASDGQKVTLKIGNRIPYATGSFQTNTAAALVSTQFNYADVGVNIDMTPQVHANDEITLHIEVTVSSVQQYVNIGGISQPVIGQRSNIADLRLHEGEVNIMGGLSQTQDTNNGAGIPGLIDIPVLGKFLFGSSHVDKLRSDLLIVLVPHILRTPGYTAENLRGIYAGTDQVVKINYASAKTEGAPTNPAPSNPGPNSGPGAAAAPAPGGAPAQERERLQTQPQAGAPAQPTSPLAALQAGLSGGPGGGTRVSFLPNAVIAAEGSPIPITVQLNNVNNLSDIPTLKIKYDPKLLRLEDVAPGDLLSRDGVMVTSVKDIRNDVGEASITLTRAPGSAPVSGTGGAATFTFTAITSGMGTVRVTELGLKNAQGQPMSAQLGEVQVTAQ